MKIRAHILDVATNGESLVVHAQGAAVAGGEFASIEPLYFRVPATATTQRTYHVGREILITIEAK